MYVLIIEALGEQSVTMPMLDAVNVIVYEGAVSQICIPVKHGDINNIMDD